MNFGLKKTTDTNLSKRGRRQSAQDFANRSLQRAGDGSGFFR
jgi:hypothetical protein